MAKIFLIDDDETSLNVTALFLRAQGYEVQTSSSARRALPLLSHIRPDLIVTDINMPGMSGIELCYALRSDARTALTPLIFISGASSVADKLACFDAGADDYISKPVDQRELQARIAVQLRKVAERGAVNSLTILPGGRMVESILNMLVQHTEFKFAVLYIDLDSFKAYNDYYGFARGNQVILLLAEVLREVLGEESDDLNFVGHIGGDDFIAITGVAQAEAACQQIIAIFDARIPALYDVQDRERGHIIAPSRQGDVMAFPIISLSIGVISNEHHALNSVLQIGQLSADVKHAAKLIAGSSYYFDQRRE